MRAILSLAHGPHQVKLGELRTPSNPGPGEAILKVKAVGVCGSDIHVYHGTESYPMRYPVALGHEMTGEVTAIGPGVTDFAPGDRVVSETAYSVCGTCLMCRQGQYNLCPRRLGFGALVHGGMAEYVLTRAAICHHLPPKVDDVTAALTEPTCVAFHALTVNTRIIPGDTVVVIGPGPVGLMAVQVARLFNPRQLAVIGTPADQARLELARQFGADATYTKATDAERKLAAAGFGSGADVIIDAAGVTATLAPALQMVRPGGQITKIGWGPQVPEFSLDPLVAKAVRLHGSFSHTWETWERVLALMARGDLSPQRMAATYPFDNWEAGFQEMASYRIAKAVLTL